MKKFGCKFAERLGSSGQPGWKKTGQLSAKNDAVSSQRMQELVQNQTFSYMNQLLQIKNTKSKMNMKTFTNNYNRLVQSVMPTEPSYKTR
jgi:hypothetical protein